MAKTYTVKTGQTSEDAEKIIEVSQSVINETTLEELLHKETVLKTQLAATVEELQGVQVEITEIKRLF